MQLGTKNNQRRRASLARSGLQTQPAKRATHENLGTFTNGQKLRNGKPMSQRYTAALVSGAAKTRTPTPRQRRKLASEAPVAPSGMVSDAAAAAKPRARKRNALRAAGMRYVREVGPGLNVNAPGSWIDVTGASGVPTIGTLRVHVRRMAHEWHQGQVDTARGMITSAMLEADGDVPEVC